MIDECLAETPIISRSMVYVKKKYVKQEERWDKINNLMYNSRVDGIHFKIVFYFMICVTYFTCQLK